MKQKIKIYLIIIFSFALVFLIIVPLRGWGLSILGLNGRMQSSLLGVILYYFLMMWITSKYREKTSPKSVLICALIGMSILPLPVHVIDFTPTLGTLFEYIIHLLIVIAAYFCYKLELKSKIIVSIFILVCGFWLSTTGNKLWQNKLNYGSFTGALEAKVVSVAPEFTGEDGQSVFLSAFKGKYLVLDCWYTHCGYCYQDMPHVQKLYEKYKDNPWCINI